jgi:hypothetical protein
MKQYNFIIENRLITVTSENLKSADKLAELISKQLKKEQE